MWEVTAKELGFPLPSGYRVLEDADVVVLVNPFGHQIFVGSATSTTRDALRAAIEQDLAMLSHANVGQTTRTEDHTPGA